MDNEKCSKEHVTCAFYNTKNSMHCASCRHRVLFLSEQLLAEQAKNKKLVEALEKIENCWNNIDSDKFAGHRLYIILQQALDEVNK